MTLAEAASGFCGRWSETKRRPACLAGLKIRLVFRPLAEKREDQYPIRRAVDLFNALAGKGRRQFSCQRAEEVGFHP
jgi:hypothetical protein